jgi:plastocyanin
MKHVGWIVPVALAAAVFSGCGGDAAPASTLPPGYYISISGMRYSPLNIQVPPGETVTVLNKDTSMPHSVTSQAAPGTYARGGSFPFDTGEFVGGQRTFIVPITAPDGTTLSYYCSYHGSQMVTPNGTITVKAAAQPGPAPAPPPGGGY